MDLLPTLKKQQLLIPHDQIVVGVSGGLDSCVLLHLLWRFSASSPLKIVVAHLNHGLRGAESRADAEFVATLCRQYQIDCIVKTLSTDDLDSGNLQETARHLRYQWFEDLALQHQCSKIVTAHHADDQVETFLMRLLRGSRSRGLSGMAYQSILKPTELQLVRPFLSFDRKQIQAYALDQQLTWREDSSNCKTDYLRNHLRLRIIPELKVLQPQLTQLIHETTQTLQAENQWMDYWIETEMADHWQCQETQVSLSLTWLQKLPSALRLRLYQKAILHLWKSLRGLYAKHLKMIEALVLSPRKTTKITLPHQTLVQVDSQKKQLVFCQRAIHEYKKGRFY